MSTALPVTPRQKRLSLRTIAAVCLLALTIVGVAHVVVRVKAYDDFTRGAFRLMSSFTEAKLAGQPLDLLQPEFAKLAKSDRALGRMLAIAFVERTSSLQARDRAIVTAANELAGKDLYRLLSAASPMFEPEARKSYLEDGAVGNAFPGVDMRFSTLNTQQRDAMHDCLDALEPVYSTDTVKSRLKVAATLYTGARWETCTVPLTARPTAPKEELDRAI